MTRDERSRMLGSFGSAPMALSSVLRQLPKKMWLYKPAPQQWSIHEIIVHLADSEASSYVQVRRLIAEPGQMTADFDPERWAGSLGYFHQSTRESLEIIRRLRRMTYCLLLALPDSAWLHTLADGTAGTITLEEWVERQERHIPHHIDQVKSNYALWIGTHPPRKPAARIRRDSVQAGLASLTPEMC